MDTKTEQPMKDIYLDQFKKILDQLHHIGDHAKQSNDTRVYTTATLLANLLGSILQNLQMKKVVSPTDDRSITYEKVTAKTR